MDNHKLMLKISRLLPSSFSSCHLRSLPDVSESSIKITKQNELSPHKTLPPSRPPKTQKQPPAAHSSTSNGGWFSSSDEVETTETFFSLSSNSGDSFHLRAAGHTFKQMKSIDEVGRRSFSSAASFDAVVPAKCTRRTAAPATGGKRTSKAAAAADHHELGSDLVSTQIYYGGGGCRRRKGGRERGRSKKGSGGGGGAGAGESIAVEKSSSDPRGDFRASMVEMIVEKQIFAAADLERLLRCFLSLNAAAYHGLIIDVFSEICQTLFTN